MRQKGKKVTVTIFIVKKGDSHHFSSHQAKMVARMVTVTFFPTFFPFFPALCIQR